MKYIGLRSNVLFASNAVIVKVIFFTMNW